MISYSLPAPREAAWRFSSQEADPASVFAGPEDLIITTIEDLPTTADRRSVTASGAQP